MYSSIDSDAKFSKAANLHGSNPHFLLSSIIEYGSTLYIGMARKKKWRPIQTYGEYVRENEPWGLPRR